ncbi:MAG: hypothetical protein IT560_10960 [Alphaproteobacteria bacterium]|nr:hypothetical protein [Alphaproteobacteria bacterium]
MNDPDYRRITVSELGIRRLSLKEAGELVAKCLWLEGELPDSETVKIKDPDRDWSTIFDPELDEPLGEHIKKFTQLLIAAVTNKELKAEIISRSLEGEIIGSSTFISADDLMEWLEERGIGYGDFFDEYFQFENDLFSQAFDFVQAERIRKKERKLQLDKTKRPFFSEDEYLILSQKYLTLQSENQSLRANTENIKPISEKQRSAYLNIIGALLGVLLGKSPSGKPYSLFNSQQAIIDIIQELFTDKNGLSKRNLEEKFSQAKRNLEGQ